jgi:hypothetical protein
MDTTKPEQA